MTAPSARPGRKFVPLAEFRAARAALWFPLRWARRARTLYRHFQAVIAASELEECKAAQRRTIRANGGKPRKVFDSYDLEDATGRTDCGVKTPLPPSVAQTIAILDAGFDALSRRDSKPVPPSDGSYLQ